MEKVSVYTDRDDPSPAELKGYMAEVFADLDANPRKLMLSLDVHNNRGSVVKIDMKDGEPVFVIEGRPPVAADFRGRWIAEHPVPLVLPEYGRMKLVLEPVDANRVRVRRPTWKERLFG